MSTGPEVLASEIKGRSEHTNEQTAGKLHMAKSYSLVPLHRASRQEGKETKDTVLQFMM